MAHHEGVVASVPLRLHTVLLALAGRIDDSALGHARHLTALARIDEAAELIAGTLIAGRSPLRPSEHRELGEVFAASGADVALLDQLVINEQDVEPTHEFGANDQPDAGIAQAIEPIKAALPDVRSIHAVWRNTASGRVPGQVPQRVVLVELGAQGSPPATAHLVAAALRNAGIRAVVEVACVDVVWPNYHQQALAAAVVVDGANSAHETSREEHAAPAPQPEPAPEPERHGESAGFFTAQDKPAFAAHAAPEFSGHGGSASTHAAVPSTVADGMNQTNGFAPPHRTNGHHGAPEQSSESHWPQPQPAADHVAAPQPAEPPQAEHTAAPAPSADHGIEPPRPENNFAPPRADHPGEPHRNGHNAEPRADPPAGPRQHEAVEPPCADHVAAPQSNGTAPEPPRSHTAEAFPNAQPPEPRNGYPEPPRNGHHAEPPRNGHPVELPRADRAAGPTRSDYPAEPPNGSNVVHFPESEVESTTEMSRSDAQRLHQALRAAEAADRGAPQAPQREAVELPAAGAEAQLSNRDRELLRELHAELAKREREQAAQVQLNGWHRPGA
ncbi:MAG: hypothetical protein GEU97_17965 [Actinophytocola sp.]|nr:hypothetical protein [Actinophytocola sp.]